MGKKYYAVRNGRNTGIYNTWNECKSQVNGYSGCSFKSFSTKSEAQAYMNGSSNSSNSSYSYSPYSSSSYNSGSSSYKRSSYSNYKPSYNNDSYSSSSSSSNRNNYRKSTGSYGGSSFGGGFYSYSSGSSGSNGSSSANSNNSNSKATAYVDGSYNEATGEYGSGAVIFHDSKEHRFKEKFNDPQNKTMRNVAGELEATKKAINYCVDNNISKVDIYYDYSGIEEWANGNWKTNKPGTKAYKEFYDSVKDKVDVNFIKVKAHSNNKYNDVADQLAKSAVGNI